MDITSTTKHSVRRIQRELWSAKCKEHLLMECDLAADGIQLNLYMALLGLIFDNLVYGCWIPSLPRPVAVVKNCLY